MMTSLFEKLAAHRAARLLDLSPYWREMADLSPALLPYWKKTAHIEFEGIPRDAFFYTRAAEGLMAFFDCVRHSAMPCGLPSKAADSVWHAWLRFDAPGLQQFCRKHFGAEIAHVEAPAMPGGMNQAMANCLVQARAREGLDSVAPALPGLFTLDARVRMPRGFAYSSAGNTIFLSAMSEKGRPAYPRVRQEFLSAAGLLGAGLISQSAYASYMARYEDDDGGASSSMSIGGDCDSGNDGGDGGGGCAGGCGGGCGS